MGRLLRRCCLIAGHKTRKRVFLTRNRQGTEQLWSLCIIPYLFCMFKEHACISARIVLDFNTLYNSSAKVSGNNPCWHDFYIAGKDVLYEKV